MSATATITIPSIILHLRGDDGSLGTLIDEFLDIIEEHQDLSDPLSEQLTLWSDGALELLSREDLIDEKLFALKLHELLSILTNPLDGSPIEHPRLSGGRLWEEWMLMQVKELFNDTSCYSDEACLREVEPHIFAERILRWKDKIALSTHPKMLSLRREIEELYRGIDKTGWLDKESSLRARPYESIATYVELASNTEHCLMWQRVSEKVEKATFHFQRVSEASEERMRSHVDAMKAFALDSEESLAEDLERIKQSFARAVSSLRTSLAEAKRENAFLERRLVCAEERISSLTTTLSRLEARVQAAEAQNRANSEAAHSDGGGGCTIM